MNAAVAELVREAEQKSEGSPNIKLENLEAMLGSSTPHGSECLEACRAGAFALPVALRNQLWWFALCGAWMAHCGFVTGWGVDYMFFVLACCAVVELMS